jgi:hypothetical protein
VTFRLRPVDDFSDSLKSLLRFIGVYKDVEFPRPKIVAIDLSKTLKRSSQTFFQSYQAIKILHRRRLKLHY